MNLCDTIAAIATGPGGALGIIRVSGNDAISVVEKIFISRGKKKLSERPASSAIYGTILDSKGQEIDDVIVTLFKAPHSYTGEDSVEISCHNSPYILHTILELIIDNGCRMSAPGEYTQRAFLNGKLDLSQAESVADLISSRTAASHRLALNQMRGHLSDDLRKMRDKLLELSSLMELELDFSDHEELEFADRSQLDQLSFEIEQHFQKLINSFHIGNSIKNGIPVAIVGNTNVGKSTLLNAFLGEDRAIVSSIEGTTRDTIEDTITLDGHLFRFIDTAGIRKTFDPIEKLGIDRTYAQIDKAEIVIWIIDSTRFSQTLPSSPDKFQKMSHAGNHIIVVNKCDMLPNNLYDEYNTILSDYTCPKLFISAKTRKGIDNLSAKLIEVSNLKNYEANDVILCNLRHYEALKNALKSITHLRSGFNTAPTDLLVQDIRECIYHINDIIGEITSSDILHNIFSHFCIGK